MSESFVLETLSKDNHLSSLLLLEDNGQNIKLSYKSDAINLYVEDEYPFFALLKLRAELEKLNLILLCMGSRKDVYPSGMSANGLMAYKMVMGKPARELVNIFEPTKDIENIGTVAEQKAYRDLWLKSLA